MVAGTILVAMGDVREIVAPPGSATAGSKWLETTITYTNTSGRPVWISGYSESSPFYGIETRTDSAGGWIEYGLGFCGFGVDALEHEIAPGASHSFQAALPERYVNQEFRVLVLYRMTRDGHQWLQAVSEARRLSLPDQVGDGG